jgi:hypothetical protein
VCGRLQISMMKKNKDVTITAARVMPVEEVKIDEKNGGTRSQKTA